MYIRQVKHTAQKTGKAYYDYRIVETSRSSSGNVQQHLLFNLGAQFNLPKERWGALTKRIKEVMSGQLSLFEPEHDIEPLALSYAKEIAKKRIGKNNYQTVDVKNMQHHQIRTIGGEYVSYKMIKELDLPKKLIEFGMNKKQANVAIGLIVGRMLNPGSEIKTYEWLRDYSGLDDLMGCSFSNLSKDQVYRTADKLFSIKNKLEKYLYTQEQSLFKLQNTITLYDLTNTYFEGSGKYNDKAQYGRSKEKRSDCPLVTLGIVLDEYGFAKGSEIFNGNVSEPKTLKQMLKKLEKKCDSKPTIVLDAGIAIEESINELKEEGYDYIVVSRKRSEPPDLEEFETIREKDDNVIKAKLVEQDDEILLYCHSKRKEETSQCMKNNFAKRYEDELKKLASGLLKKRGTSKKPETIRERIGRLKERYRSVVKYYDINVKTKNNKVIELTWKRKEIEDHPGIYCLRTSRKDLNAKSILDTYTMLTDLEDSFRCMKSELGLRPVYHQKTERVDGHLFITILAYHIMHSIRHQLKSHAINLRWKGIREKLSTHIRVTTTMKREDGKTVHVRKSSVPDYFQQTVYQALSLPNIPGKTEVSIWG